MGAGTSANLACGSGLNAVAPQEIPNFKVVLVGDPEVGKTSIFLRFTKNQFDYSYQPTMKVNIGDIVKKVHIPYETVVSVTVWDLPGREEMDLRRSYYRDVDAAIVVVDLSDGDSIDMAGTWRQDILNNIFLSDDEQLLASSKKEPEGPRTIPILLVGNKLDKIAESNVQNEDDDANPVKALEKVAEQHGFVGSAAVSAKESDGGVYSTMTSLIRYLLDKYLSRAKKKVGKPYQPMKHVFGTVSDKKSYMKTLGSVDDHNFVPLELTGISELDDIFMECSESVRVIETSSIALVVARRHFRKACALGGITDSTKASIEECITGLRDLLRCENDDEVLEAHEDGGFLRLTLKEGYKFPSESTERAVQIFVNEVTVTAKQVLKNCPMAKVDIQVHSTGISEFKNIAHEKCADLGLNQKQCKLVMEKIENNQGRLSETVALAEDSMSVVDDEYKRIKTAMLW